MARVIVIRSRDVVRISVLVGTRPIFRDPCQLLLLTANCSCHRFSSGIHVAETLFTYSADTLSPKYKTVAEQLLEESMVRKWQPRATFVLFLALFLAMSISIAIPALGQDDRDADRHETASPI